MHHNGNHVPNSSQGSTDARHFNSLGRRLSTPLNQNTKNENYLYTNTITQDIKQHYPTNTIVKDKIKSWPTVMLDDSESVAAISDTKIIKQAITNLLKENEMKYLDTQSKA